MTERKCIIPFGEMLDKLCILQLKQIFSVSIEDLKDYEESIVLIVNSLISRSDVDFDAKFLSLLMLLSQVNLDIWNAKEKMMEDNFIDNLVLSHKLNGIRNTIKNKLSSYAKECSENTNTNTDGLTYGKNTTI